MALTALTSDTTTASRMLAQIETLIFQPATNRCVERLAARTFFRRRKS